MLFSIEILNEIAITKTKVIVNLFDFLLTID